VEAEPQLGCGSAAGCWPIGQLAAAAPAPAATAAMAAQIMTAALGIRVRRPGLGRTWPPPLFERQTFDGAIRARVPAAFRILRVNAKGQNRTVRRLGSSAGLAVARVRPGTSRSSRCDTCLVPLTILIVDDHEGFRQVARALLEADGIEVVGEAADGESVITEVGGLRPQLVLLMSSLAPVSLFARGRRHKVPACGGLSVSVVEC